jgi:hypothetical protein
VNERRCAEPDKQISMTDPDAHLWQGKLRWQWYRRRINITLATAVSAVDPQEIALPDQIAKRDGAGCVRAASPLGGFGAAVLRFFFFGQRGVSKVQPPSSISTL